MTALAAVFGFGVALLGVAGWHGITSLGPTIQLSDLAFALAALLALVAVVRRELRVRFAPADLALVAYAGAAALSAIGAPSPRASLIKILGLGLLGTIFFLGRHLIQIPRARSVLLSGWLAGAAVAALAGLAGLVMFYLGFRGRAENPFIAAYGSIPVGNYPRVVGFFSNANMFCSAMVAALAVIAMMWEEVGSPRVRRLLVVLAAACLVNVLFTLSVGMGGLALGAALWWKLIGGRGRNLALVAAAAVALGFAALTLVQLVPRGAGDFGAGPFDIKVAEGGRIDIWRGALHTIEQHPLTGQGYGTLVGSTDNPRAWVSMEKWGTAQMSSTQRVPLEAHNVWLNVTGQTGILGLVCFAAFVFLALRGSAAAVPALFCGVLATLLYHGLFAALEDARHVWLLLGLAAARPR